MLAAVGLYSVLSTTVRQRTAEIGVRMAFGAEHGSIFRMMVGQGLRLSAAGIALGVGGGAAADTASLRNRCSSASSRPIRLTFVGMTAGFLVIAAVACGVPALRASRLDPMAALRDE